MSKYQKKTKQFAIIIPAYKEANNIQILTKKIFDTLPDAYIVIVDDSPKEEFNALKSVIGKQKDIILIARSKKMGRGSAVLYGLNHALQNKSIRYFFEMDADLAHDPSEFTLFLKESHNADLVIGSRYLKKSNIIKWPLRRLVMSRIINLFLRVWLGLDLSDYTNGYRLYSRRAVAFIVKQNLKESGFIALSEIAYKLKKNNFSIKEIPITFTDRKYGKSNAGTKELLDSLIGALKIRLRN